MTIALHGLGISQGIAIGQAHVLDVQADVTHYSIAAENIDAEVKRFNAALALAKQQLSQIREEIPLIYAENETHQEIVSFIDPHLLMLEDSMLKQIPLDLIREQHCNAEWALQLQRDKLVSVFNAMEDPYLKERKQDVKQLVDRIQQCLSRNHQVIVNQAFITDCVVFGDSLLPADIALMTRQGVKGFLSQCGGVNSHSAIITRSLGIPAVSGLSCAQQLIRDDDMIIVDGLKGTVLIDPDEISLDYYQNLQVKLEQRRSQLQGFRSIPTISQDQVEICLQANMEFPEEINIVQSKGVQNIGLYRTEFLFMQHNTAPDEDLQFQVYKKVLKAFASGTVTIRTLDLGADKQTSYLGDPSHDSALGLRAVRLCLKKPDLLKIQLRAILRASVFGQARILFPMLTNLQELKQIKQLWQQSCDELAVENVAYDTKIPIGGMVEVPAMALCVDLFAPHLDFMSIGTNDLIQYTLAIDRNDAQVNHLYDPLHPAVLRILKQIIDQAGVAKIDLGLCGEMAGDLRYVRLLLGLGLRCFSVSPESYLSTKKQIINTNISQLSGIMDRLLRATNSTEIKNLIAEMNSL